MATPDPKSPLALELQRFAMECIKHGTWLVALDEAYDNIMTMVSRETIPDAVLKLPAFHPSDRDRRDLNVEARWRDFKGDPIKGRR